MFRLCRDSNSVIEQSLLGFSVTYYSLASSKTVLSPGLTNVNKTFCWMLTAKPNTLFFAYITNPKVPVPVQLHVTHVIP